MLRTALTILTLVLASLVTMEIWDGEKIATTGFMAQPSDMASHFVTRHRAWPQNQMVPESAQTFWTSRSVYGHSGLSQEEIRPVTNEMFLFWAPWCDKCPTMKTIAGQIKQEGYKVTLINTDQHRKMLSKYNIAQIPHTIIFAVDADGTPIVAKQFVGTVDNRTIRQYLKKPITPDPEPDYDIW